MLNNMLVVKILSGLVLGAVAMWARRRDSREAERAFSSLSVKSLDPRLCLEGATAKIVLNRVASDSRTPYSLFRICKNEHGEYFLYMYNGAPYVTHLSHPELHAGYQAYRKSGVGRLEPVRDDSGRPRAAMRRSSSSINAGSPAYLPAPRGPASAK